jgi:hypothetical protein
VREREREEKENIFIVLMIRSKLDDKDGFCLYRDVKTAIKTHFATKITIAAFSYYFTSFIIFFFVFTS